MQLSDQCFCLWCMSNCILPRTILPEEAPKITQATSFIKYLFHPIFLVEAVLAAYTCADQYVQVDGDAPLDCMNMP